MVLLAAIFGSSFLFMRIAAPDVGPFMVAGVRVGIAAVVLLAVLVLRREVGKAILITFEDFGPHRWHSFARQILLVSAADAELTNMARSVDLAMCLKNCGVNH